MKRKLKASTVEKFCDVFIHLGEASIIVVELPCLLKALLAGAKHSPGLAAVFL